MVAAMRDACMSARTRTIMATIPPQRQRSLFDGCVVLLVVLDLCCLFVCFDR